MDSVLFISALILWDFQLDADSEITFELFVPPILLSKSCSLLAGLSQYKKAQLILWENQNQTLLWENDLVWGIKGIRRLPPKWNGCYTMNKSVDALKCSTATVKHHTLMPQKKPANQICRFSSRNKYCMILRSIPTISFCSYHRGPRTEPHSVILCLAALVSMFGRLGIESLWQRGLNADALWVWRLKWTCWQRHWNGCNLLLIWSQLKLFSKHWYQTKYNENIQFMA